MLYQYALTLLPPAQGVLRPHRQQARQVLPVGLQPRGRGGEQPRRETSQAACHRPEGLLRLPVGERSEDPRDADDHHRHALVEVRQPGREAVAGPRCHWPQQKGERLGIALGAEDSARQRCESLKPLRTGRAQPQFGWWASGDTAQPTNPLPSTSIFPLTRKTIASPFVPEMPPFLISGNS